MKLTTKLLCSAVVCGLVSNVAMAERRERPERVPSTGILPVVQGVGSLTVAGGDYWHQAQYEGGERPQLSAYDESGQPLPDGSYRYEFVSLPTVSDPNPALPESTAFTAAGGEERPALIESGSFTIDSGVMIFN